MTTPAPAQAPRSGLSQLKQFTLSPEGRPALVGALGATLITAGGLGAGSTRLHDPVLESMHLSWLRFGHGLVLSSVLLWAGVALMPRSSATVSGRMNSPARSWPDTISSRTWAAARSLSRSGPFLRSAAAVDFTSQI